LPGTFIIGSPGDTLLIGILVEKVSFDLEDFR